MVNVGKYTSPMDPMVFFCSLFLPRFAMSFRNFFTKKNSHQGRRSGARFCGAHQEYLRRRFGVGWRCRFSSAVNRFDLGGLLLIQGMMSGQIITTSAEVTLNGGLIRELPQNPLNSGLGIILICPDDVYTWIFQICKISTKIGRFFGWFLAQILHTKGRSRYIYYPVFYLGIIS